MALSADVFQETRISFKNGRKCSMPPARKKGNTTGPVAGPDHGSEYITTGKAAKLLLVTSDTILRWIKEGKLPTRKTAGGHNRIPLDSVMKLASPKRSQPVETMTPPERSFVPCWKFNAADGRIKESCRSCLVFKARGDRCYEVGVILKRNGQGAMCCPTECEECAYYRHEMQRPVNVLIFTDNEALKESLTTESGPSRLRLQFTSCAYDCSLVVDSFRPEYVVVDCAMELVKCEELCMHLANDPRIPWVKIMLAVPPGAKCGANLLDSVAVVDQPFGIDELESYVEPRLLPNTDFPDAARRAPAVIAFNSRVLKVSVMNSLPSIR
jgi:excisionase family DNA binding protein